MSELPPSADRERPAAGGDREPPGVAGDRERTPAGGDREPSAGIDRGGARSAGDRQRPLGDRERPLGDRERPPGDRDRPPGDRPTPFVRLTNLTGRTALRLLTRVTVEGLERPLPRSGPLIVAANHLSNADGILVSCWVSDALGRRIHWLGKEEIVRVPIVGRLAEAYGIFGVRRGAADLEAYRIARSVLERGLVLGVFPEGTRSPTGALQPAREGLAVLALRTGAPILPLGVAGTDRFWPRGGLPRPGRPIALRVGEPFRLSEVLPPGLERREAVRLATTEVMRRIAALLPPRHRGVYADLVEPAAPETPVAG